MLSVLIVEDEKNTAKLMGDILKNDFTKIYYSYDGINALAKFKKYRPDIVVCDVLMPLLDGLNLTRHIKEISPSTPVIIISAHSDKDKLLKAIDVSVSKYLIKPILPEELLNTVRNIIAGLNKEVILNDCKLDFIKGVFVNKGEEILLSSKELALLKALCEPVGRVVSKDEIKELCWGDPNIKDGSIRTFIKRLRDKIKSDIIKNITSTGYKISLK